MKGFREKTLGEILTFQRGFDITKKEQSPGIVPIVSSSGISSYHNQSKVKAPGVVIGRKGTLGTVHHIRQNFWPHDTTLWIKDFKRNEPRFIYYFLKTLHLEAFDTGSSNPTLNRNHLHKIKVVFPELNIQRKIAAILSAYDDLIENNKRRIALLENMAEEIYREWFVRFRFPGYQTAEFEKGIPKGWNLVSLEHAFKYLGGGTPSKNNYTYWNEGSIDWYTPSDITGSNGLYMTSSGDHPNEEGLARSSAKLFPAYSIMMTSRATIGAIGINRTAACTNQGFITCIPNKQYPLTYLYHWLKLNKEYFISLCGGATFPELNKTTFKKIEILTPEKNIVSSFDELVKPLLHQIEHLICANNILLDTENNLLPRLISGKLSVENLDIQFPPSMQDTPTTH